MKLQQTINQDVHQELRLRLECQAGMERDVIERIETLNQYRHLFKEWLKRQGCRKVPWRYRFQRCAIAGIGLLLLAGCVSQPTAKPVAVTDQMPVVSDVSGQAVGQPTGENVNIEIGESPSSDVAGYKLWYGPKSSNYTNSIAIGQTTVATLTNLMLPVFVAATAYNADGADSPFSNEVAVRGWDTVVTINALTNTALNTNWTLSHTIWTATNPPTGFWKLEAVRTMQAK